MRDGTGQNRKTILSESQSTGINSPVSIGVYDSRLYFVDPVFEKVAKVDVTGENYKVIKENELELKAISIFRKRSGEEIMHEKSYLH